MLEVIAPVFIHKMRLGLIQNRRERTQITYDTVDTALLQLQSSIIEQQMSLIRVSRLYQEYLLNKSAVLELPPGANHHQALIQCDEREANPRTLVQYQEPSLSQGYPSRTEMEDLARVRRIARPYIDTLLHRWTRPEEARMLKNPSFQRSSTSSDRGRWEQPTVESDSEDDFDVPRDPSRRLDRSAPILMPVNENEDVDFERSPPVSPLVMTGYASSLLRSRSPRRSSRASSPLSRASSPFSRASSLSSRRLSLSSRSSISLDNYTSRATPPSPHSPIFADAAAVTALPYQNNPDPKNIPWRLCLNSTYWDYQGPKITGSNTRSSHIPALSDRNAMTEILATFVVREALDEAALPYRSVNRDSFDGHRTRFDACFLIQRPMGWEEVRRLVARSQVLRRKGGKRG